LVPPNLSQTLTLSSWPGFVLRTPALGLLQQSARGFGDFFGGGTETPQRRQAAASGVFESDPAIDDELDAGYVFGFVGGEIEAGTGYVPSVAHMAHRALRIARPPHRLDVALAVFGRKTGRSMSFGV
jgi:hypothetical protein